MSFHAYPLVAARVIIAGLIVAFGSSGAVNASPKLSSAAGQASVGPTFGAMRAVGRAPSLTEKVLYNFGGPGCQNDTDGGGPMGGLLQVDDSLFGTTFSGGTNGSGTIFRINLSHNTYKSVYSFTYKQDAASPSAGLTKLGSTLYGTSRYGGTNGKGTVFQYKIPGGESVLYSFTGGPDGANPYAGLLNVDGTLYGTTNAGGTSNAGTVFSITPSGQESVLYSFTGGADGAYPYAGLVNVGGTLYGTTFSGGAYNEGAVFSISTPGNEKVVYSFTGGADGRYPAAGLVDFKGTLYGTTEYGGQDPQQGTVFSVTKSGKEKVLHYFPSAGGDGGYPIAGLVNVSGTLYGTTQQGGVYNDNYGTVFSIALPTKTYSSFSFAGSPTDGEEPYAGLLNVNGRLYGTTYLGGACHGGTVFSIKP